MIVGTESGRLLLLESGELKTEFNVTKSDYAEERFKRLILSSDLSAFFGLIFYLFIDSFVPMM